MITSINPGPDDRLLHNIAGKALGQPDAAGSLFHGAFLLAQCSTDRAFPDPADLEVVLHELLGSLDRTRRLLAGTRQAGHPACFTVLGPAGGLAVLPEDGRFFAHLCDTAGEDWSAFFNGLIHRNRASVWTVDLGVLTHHARRLLAAYTTVQSQAAAGAPDPALVEYWPDEQTRKGSCKLDSVLGLDRREPVVMDLKTTQTRPEPAGLDDWRTGSPGEAQRLARDAQLLADDLRRPVRQAVLVLSAAMGRGTYRVDPVPVQPNERAQEAESNVLRRRIWLRDSDLAWLEEFTPTWVDPALLTPP